MTRRNNETGDHNRSFVTANFTIALSDRACCLTLESEFES